MSEMNLLDNLTGSFLRLNVDTNAFEGSSKLIKIPLEYTIQYTIEIYTQYTNV